MAQRGFLFLGFEYMSDKIATHPDRKQLYIKFMEKFHTYTDNTGRKYISGTTFVGKAFPKFDAIAVSRICADGDNPKYAGRTPEEIRAEWKKEGELASMEGTNVHEYAEGIVSGWPTWKLPKPATKRCFDLLPHVHKIASWLKKKYEFLEAEKIIFSPDLGIAGMVDLIMLDHTTGEILILDWKTNKEITIENNFQSAFPPLDHLQDTHKNKYSLQLSLYQYIIEKENYYPGANGYRRALIHVADDGIHIHKCEYYKWEIEQLIARR